jgi:uncharacterized protein YjbI with pentapeptide repeats
MITYNTLSSQELLRAYSQGQRHFENIEVEDGQSFAGHVLSQATFSKCLLSNIDFSGADLGNAFFKDCNLKCSQFDNAVLANCTIENCAVEASTFKNASMNGFAFRQNYYYGLTIGQNDFHEVL